MPADDPPVVFRFPSGHLWAFPEIAVGETTDPMAQQTPWHNMRSKD